MASETLDILSRSPLFEMLSNLELGYVAGLARVRRVEAQGLVYEEGDSGNGLYVIVSGEVELVMRDGSGGEEVMAVLSSPQMFGELTVVDSEYRSTTARACTAAELLHLTSEDLTTFRRKHPDGFTLLVLNIAKVLSARLREALSQLAARR